VILLMPEKKIVQALYMFEALPKRSGLTTKHKTAHGFNTLHVLGIKHIAAQNHG